MAPTPCAVLEPTSDSIRNSRGEEPRSGLWVEQTPGHGTNLIEGVHGITGPGSTDRSGVGEQRQQTGAGNSGR